MRKYLLLLAAMCCVGLTTVGIAWAVTPSVGHTVSGAETRVVHYYATGPSVDCKGIQCTNHYVRLMRFELPQSEHLYSGTITVSFTYSSHGTGPFDLSGFVAALDGTGREPYPHFRPLAPASVPTSQTVVFRVLRVPGGEPYVASLRARLGHRHHGSYGFTVSSAVVELRVSTS